MFPPSSSFALYFFLGKRERENCFSLLFIYVHDSNVWGCFWQQKCSFSFYSEATREHECRSARFTAGKREDCKTMVIPNHKSQGKSYFRDTILWNDSLGTIENNHLSHCSSAGTISATHDMLQTKALRKHLPIHLLRQRYKMTFIFSIVLHLGNSITFLQMKAILDIKLNRIVHLIYCD